MAPSSPIHPPLPAELMAAGSDLRRDREAHDLLVHSLALPLWRPMEAQQHWAVRGRVQAVWGAIAVPLARQPGSC